MTTPAVFCQALTAMLAGPLGSDVVYEATELRGILTREWREQSDASGMQQQLWTTVLTVKDGALPATCREGAELTIAGTVYVVRRKCREDDMGAREYFVVERTS